jgi:hypothetical protein
MIAIRPQYVENVWRIVTLWRLRPHGTFLLRQPLVCLPAAAKKGGCSIRTTACCAILRSSKVVRASLALKFLLLALMAAVCVLASNLDAFFRMNRNFWFRKARNATVFFFVFLKAAAVTIPGLLSGRF